MVVPFVLANKSTMGPLTMASVVVIVVAITAVVVVAVITTIIAVVTVVIAVVDAIATAIVATRRSPNPATNASPAVIAACKF